MTDLQNAGNALINKFGVNISYVSPTGSGMNAYGDENFTWSDPTTIKAIISTGQEGNLMEVPEGGLIVGRNVFYLPYDTSISIGDKITHNSIEYETEEVLRYHFFNKYTVLRVSAHRISD